MSVLVTGNKIKDLVDAQKGRDIIKILSDAEPAAELMTICVVLASMLPTVCDSQEDAEFTMSELSRFINELTSKVFEARASGELKTEPNEMG